MIIDTHAHLNDEKFCDDYEDVIENLKLNGVELVINVGFDQISSRNSIELAEKFDNCYSIIGVHPHESKNFDESTEKFLMENAKNKKVLAIGEIGLDYYYDLSPRDVQKKVFIRQLEIANELKLPVVFHVRDAYGDVLEILKEHKHLINNGGIVHCYSGSVESAKEFLKFGLSFSFGGAITFKNTRKNLEALDFIPLDRIVLETDCPYMTPEPFRGKRNEPKNLKYVLQKVSEVKQLPVEELEKIFKQNCFNIFKKLGK